MGKFGKKIGVFQDGIFRYKILILCNTIIILSGILCFWLLTLPRTGINSDGSRNSSYMAIKDGGVALIFFTGLALVILGIIFFIIALYIINKRKFNLSEFGIASEVRGVKESEILFSEIQDVYLFPAKIAGYIIDMGLAYRKNSEDLWKVITPSLKNYKRLIEKFREMHKKQNLEAKKGENRFFMINKSDYEYFSSQMLQLGFAKGFKFKEKRKINNKLEKFLKPVRITGNIIEVKNGIYTIEKSDKIEIDEKKGIISVTDETERKKYSFKMGEIISFDAFYDKLNNITEE